MKWILRVEYRKKVNGKYEYYKVDFDYNGCTDKMQFQWVKDSDKIAYDNCKPNEDVMGYELIVLEVNKRYYLDSRITCFSCVEEIKSYIDTHTINNPFIIKYSTDYGVHNIEVVVKEYKNGKALVLDDDWWQDFIIEV